MNSREGKREKEKRSWPFQRLLHKRGDAIIDGGCHGEGLTVKTFFTSFSFLILI
jgi:hypothetical protein